MNLSKQIAKHLRDVHFGGNWTCSNLKDNLADVGWEQAIVSVYSCNTIATLVFHMNYYIDTVIKVLKDEPLNAHDKYSFETPAIKSKEDWERLVNKTFNDAEELAVLIEAMTEEKLWQYFSEEKYGSYYRNLHGIVEHVHYHLGQIVIIKKILTHKG
jgi:hypothetical protein